MNTLFTTIEQVKQFVTVDISAKFDTIKPYLVEAHKWVKKGIDIDTFNELITYANAETQDDTELDALL